MKRWELIKAFKIIHRLESDYYKKKKEEFYKSHPLPTGEFQTELTMAIDQDFHDCIINGKSLTAFTRRWRLYEGG